MFTFRLCASFLTFTLAGFLNPYPVFAQNLNGTNLTLSGTITQNGSSTNFFDANQNTFAGRACIGVTCDGTEPFEQGPLRLKWSEPDILFQDSSDTLGISSNDWRLVVNDSTVTKFAVQDIDGGTIPFTIEGAVPTNSLVLDSTGRIGMGTAIPQAAVDIVSANPAIRMQQTSSPNIWTIGAETQFTINDNSAFSVPVVFEPSAPSDSLRLTSAGALGLGIGSPSAALHLRRTNNTAALLIEETGAGTLGQMTLRNNGITFFTLEDTSIAAGDNTGRSWNFQNQAGTFRVTTAPGGPNEIEMILTPDGDMTIEGDLFTTGGVCSAGCDRVFDADYPLPTISEQAELMFANRHLPNVGPTDENGTFNVTKKVGGMLNELEKAHIYIEQLHTRQAELETAQLQVSALSETVKQQQASIKRLEELVESLATKLR